VRLLKLAFRAVLEWRRFIAPAVAAVAAVSAIVTLAGSAVAPVADAVRDRSRFELGEYAGPVPAPAAGDRLRGLGSTGLLVSASRTAAGVLASPGELLLVRVHRTDLGVELAFRGIADHSPAGSESPPSSGDAVLLAPRDGFGLRADAPPRWSSDTDRQRATRPVGRLTVVERASDESATLLVHDATLLDEVEWAGDREPTVRVRVRGAAGPLAGRAAQALPAGLTPTAWREVAAERLRPLRSAMRLLATVLVALATATLVPGQILLANRTAPSLRVLAAWGFAPRMRSRLLVAMGAFASCFASVLGSAVGLGLAAVMNARERPAVSLLPPDLAERLAPLAVSVTPSVEWAGAAAAVAALLGALTALPSAGMAATVTARRNLWHW